ncbi:DUF4271 domain-containing protein [Aquimarina hainanensis]|uniref:DUF4271 domain-containing protein n=1 Tax=Aquimarina hainanensis TaxID=1578017 RepID=A0ABW5N1G1_9FLAO|nr:DUF4271 domain-containing protein [Aquimarina sp. TRL1]QKX04427.1 DUF4271 domain-containing protein [Aquimarina sp. TRL1]
MDMITRHISDTNWITIALLFCFVFLAIAKTIDAPQFNDFIRLFNTSKYITLHQKPKRLSSSFNAMLILAQIISISLFAFICFNTLKWNSHSQDFIFFIKIMTIYGLFVIGKMLVEKIFGTVFSIDEIIEDYIFQKISYRNFIGLILLPVDIILTYTVSPTHLLVSIILFSTLLINLIILLMIYKKNENVILNNLFYFILYLCAFEIAPYFMLFKLIAR